MSSYQNVLLSKRPVTEMSVTKMSITKVSLTKMSWIPQGHTDRSSSYMTRHIELSAVGFGNPTEEAGNAPILVLS